MASTSAVTLEAQQTGLHIIAPDDSDFLDSDVDDNASSQSPEDLEIEAALLSEHTAVQVATTPASPRKSPGKIAANKMWPAHPLIRVHKRLWFTYFEELPSEKALNRDNGKAAAWTSWKDKGVDASETNPSRLHWFNIDQDLVYLPFWFDWGPFNVAMFYRFCLHVHHLLTDDSMADATLVLYTSAVSSYKANAALLAALYAMIIGKVRPADAFFPISELEFRPFRDAGYGRPDFDLSIQDILYGVYRAIEEELLDLTTFNLDEYEKYEQVQFGDWNWITPNFIAFASPNDRDYVEALRVNNGRAPAGRSFHPKPNSTFANTVRYFRERGVKLVVRLNNPLYDKRAFEDAGIEHVDMYFDDGSNPSEEILRDFIAKADKVIAENGVVAVHCKAGLGRTGVLIGAYLVWRHGFTAGEVIGFMRFMRPGCVVGPQQHFMYQNFVEWVRWSVRDHALRDAQKLIDQERAKLPNAASSARTGRPSLKRRASESDEDDGDESRESRDDEDERPRQKQRAEATPPSSTGDADGPMTPKAPRTPRRAPPASAAPAVKPTPCVGQPRKSPSPSRKRAVQQQAPATVARLELTSRSYPGLPASRSFGGGHAHALTIGHGTATVHVDAATSSAAGLHAGSNESSDEDDSSQIAHRGSRTSTVAAHSSNASNGAGVSPVAGGGGVLVESRVNVVGSTTPKASPKAAVVHLTPSPASRVRVQGHERSRSAIVPSISHTSMRSETSPQTSSPRSGQVFVARASPNIRDRYGLRDASHSPSPPGSPAPAAAVTTSPSISASIQAHAQAPPSPVKRSDAEVLGVIECIPQPPQHVHSPPTVRSYHVSPSRRPVTDENAPSPHGTANGADKNATVKETTATKSEPPATANANTTAKVQGPRVLRSNNNVVSASVSSLRSKTPTATVRSTGRGVPAPTTATATANATGTATATSGVAASAGAGTGSRRPASAAATRGGASANRSVSAKMQPIPTVRSSVLRAQKSTSELRSRVVAGGANGAPVPVRTTSVAAGTTTANGNRTASSSSTASNSSTSATVNGASRPRSRLLAPTAASAARAAATTATWTTNPAASSTTAPVSAGIKRTLTPSAAAAHVKAAVGPTPRSARSASGLQRSVRRRRSSTGEANVDVVA